MKRPFFTLFTTGVLCVSLTAGVFAGSPRADAKRGQVVAELEDGTERLSWEAQQLKASKRHADALTAQTQRLRVQNLIERIRAGESVDPREIDALLGRSPQ